MVNDPQLSNHQSPQISLVVFEGKSLDSFTFSSLVGLDGDFEPSSGITSQARMKKDTNKIGVLAHYGPIIKFWPKELVSKLSETPNSFY